MKNLVILGSTGSIGESAIRVVQAFPERFRVHALVGRRQIKRLAEQARLVHAGHVATANETQYAELCTLADGGVVCHTGMEAILELVTAPEVDIVLCAIVGTGGLLPVLAALRAGKRVALASKEVLVMAGDLVNAELATGHGELVPVDSEHSALFQCLQGRRSDEVRKLWLTASGGAFRDWPLESLERATWADALVHPVWSMGPKVTVDSASLMNKALELVEARYLFGVGPEQLGVVIHPQSVVHSMVELSDGALIAHMSMPDMRFAIQYALSYPERWEGGELPQLSWSDRLNLSFREPDRRRFPALDFAMEAIRRGGTLPAVMNAANEVAVDCFREGRISFPMIWRTIEAVMEQLGAEEITELEVVLAADRRAREAAREWVRRHGAAIRI